MNFYKNHFGMIISSVVAICISFIMATCAIFVDNLTFTVPLWIKNWGTAFLTITATGMLIPMTNLSFALCKKIGLKPETLPHVLIENAIATLFFNTTATLVLAAVNIFDNAELAAAAVAGAIPSVSAVYWQCVLHDWPIMYVISFIAAFFVTKLAIRIAKKAVGGPLITEESPQRNA